MRKKKTAFNKAIIKPTEEIKETIIEEKKPIIKEEIKPIIKEEVKPVIVKKPEKRIVNAVSVVVFNNGSDIAKLLLEQLAYQKKHSYPETEIIEVTDKNINLLDLTKGQYVVYIEKPKTIASNFLHLFYINMRSGKSSYEINGIVCKNRNNIK